MILSIYLLRGATGKMDFRIINWNIGGAKFLEQKENKRAKTRAKINGELNTLIEKYDPDVITLQEVVQYRDSNGDLIDLIDPPDKYNYYSFPLIDTDRLSFKGKWNKIRRNGGWSPETFFAQGNAILHHKNVAHVPVCSLSNGKEANTVDRHYVEQVNIESGLYFGDRNTEPRSALVSHFIFNYKNDPKPQDVFVVNIHLTTLTMEREGIPEIDLRAKKIRLNQLDIIFNGIVSRYNTWRLEGFLDRGKKLKLSKEKETIKRHEPLWVLVGDFNFTQESEEYESIKRMNFVDVIVPDKKAPGTKAKGLGKPATIVVDYIFAGPKFIALDPNITKIDHIENCVDHDSKSSDHYPCIATITVRRQPISRHN